jgi:hypothetical protein
MRDHVSHPYKTTGRIKVLYILSITFLDSRREDKRKKASLFKEKMGQLLLLEAISDGRFPARWGENLIPDTEMRAVNWTAEEQRSSDWEVWGWLLRRHTAEAERKMNA